MSCNTFTDTTLLYKNTPNTNTLPPAPTHTHTHTQLYGRLLFLLQTTPEYIAKLIRLVSLKEIDGLLQIVMFTLYGNQYEDREEHLLLSMFEVSFYNFTFYIELPFTRAVT